MSMLALRLPGASRGSTTTGAWCALRRHRAVRRSVPLKASYASDAGVSADGFAAEYELAGIKLDPLAKLQLRNWYAAELHRASLASGRAGADNDPDTAAVDGHGSKDLPPLLQRRPGVPRLTVLWDLESLKPFTQQHRPGPGEGGDDAEQQQRARASASSGRASRLAAAGLPGAASSPDLIGALDQLCRTLKQYGTLHAVHLFLRESTLSKAPVLRRQVEQLCTWVRGPRDDEAGEGPAVTATSGSGTNLTATRPRIADGSQQPAASSSGSDGGSSRVGSGQTRGPPGAGARQRAPSVLLQGDDVHDCPMCRSAYSNRLDLLRHFAAVHQAPLLVATATDARTHIMWTRGRAVRFPIAAPGDQRVGVVAGVVSTPPDDAASIEKVLVRPEEFAFARELLMRGRHLDELLASAPVAVQSSAPRAAAVSGATDRTTGRQQSVLPGTVNKDGRGDGSSGTEAGPGVPLSSGGLHLHLVPAGQPAEAAAETLRRMAEALAAEQAVSVSEPLPGRGRGRSSAGRAAQQQGRGRKGGRQGPAAVEADVATPCVCLVSDAEGIDKTLADLRLQDVLTMAVTRITRVPSADVSLRWWAIQGGEYRPVNSKQR